MIYEARASETPLGQGDKLIVEAGIGSSRLAQVLNQCGKGCGHFGIVLLRRAWLRHLDDNDGLWPAWQTII